MEEKDRLGTKLRDKEKADEDRYFAERERELLAKLRKKKQALRVTETHKGDP